MLRKIAQLGHPVLKMPSAEVVVEEITSPRIQTLIDDIIETMRDANGAGLAAPQIYEPLRICAIEVGDNPRYPYKPKVPLTILINPILTPLSDETQMFSNFEGCLSVPNLRGRVLRHPHLRVEALDRHGNPLDFETRGVTAGTFQHEVDHLDGVLFVERVVDKKSFCTWDNFSRFEQAQVAEEAKAIVAKWGS